MKLDEYLKDKIAQVFESVEYGRITFFLNPDKETLNYTVERSEKIKLKEVKEIQKNSLTVL